MFKYLILFVFLLSCRSEKDCRTNEVCERFGMCINVAGRCVTGCEQDCKNNGKCSVLWKTKNDIMTGTCYAKSNEDCKESKVCLEFGECTAIQGVCLSRNDNDCFQSLNCAQYGNCSLVKIDKFQYRCYPSSEEHCLNSWECKLYNYCYLITYDNGLKQCIHSRYKDKQCF